MAAVDKMGRGGVQRCRTSSYPLVHGRALVQQRARVFFVTALEPRLPERELLYLALDRWGEGQGGVTVRVGCGVHGCGVNG